MDLIYARPNRNESNELFRCRFGILWFILKMGFLFVRGFVNFLGKMIFQKLWIFTDKEVYLCITYDKFTLCGKFDL